MNIIYNKIALFLSFILEKYNKKTCNKQKYLFFIYLIINAIKNILKKIQLFCCAFKYLLYLCVIIRKEKYKSLTNKIINIMKTTNYIYITRDAEAGDEIDEFYSMEDAQAAIASYEAEDKRDGTFTEGFYEIVKKEMPSVNSPKNTYFCTVTTKKADDEGNTTRMVGAMTIQGSINTMIAHNGNWIHKNGGGRAVVFSMPNGKKHDVKQLKFVPCIKNLRDTVDAVDLSVVDMLKEKRLRMHISQQELADKCCVKQQVISRIERSGKTTTEMAELISKVLGCKITVE